MRKFLSVFALLGSFGTIVCCLLPFVFVSLGFGTAFASIIGAFPQLTWLSEHKGWVFGIAGVVLGAALIFHRQSRAMACPTDPRLAEGCRTAKGWSSWVLGVAITLYLLGAFFAFVAPVVFV